MKDIQVGDKVRLTGKRWEEYWGEVHTVSALRSEGAARYVEFSTLFPGAEWQVNNKEWAIEKVPESPLNRVFELFEQDMEEKADLIEEEIEGLKSFRMDTHDTDWNYYMLPSGVEARDVSQFLSSFAGQIVQYAIRSGRMDGKVKSVEDRVRDFEKIADFARWEAARLRDFPEDS